MQEFIRDTFNIKSETLNPLPQYVQRKTLQSFIDLDLTRLSRFFETTNIKSKNADPKKLAIMLDIAKSLVAEIQLMKYHDMSTKILEARILVEQDALKTKFSPETTETQTCIINYCNAIISSRQEEANESAN